MTTWIFQANPKWFDLVGAVSNFTEMSWLARQHANDIEPGDRVFLWLSGPSAGVVGVAEVTTSVQDLPPDEEQSDYYLDWSKFAGLQPRVKIELKEVLEQRLLRTELREDPVLSKLTILKAPRGTNFPLMDAQAAALDSLVEAKRKSESSSLALIEGQTYRRRTLHEAYGGQPQGGISTPARYPMVLIFTGKSGHQYGYQDEWLDADRFDYVGEGQRGDMQMSKGNAAILNHAANGELLHLFEDIGKGRCRYIGEMACIDYYTRELSDVDGRLRQGLVFRLRRTSAEQEDALGSLAQGEESDVARSRQGFRQSPAARKAIEERAMKQARDHFENEGWNVDDVHKTRPYDLVCTKNGEELRVEVKGSTTSAAEVILTRNEVDHAKIRYPNVCLFVVANIVLDMKEDGAHCDGGEATLFRPWRVDDDALKPLAFSYTVPFD